LEARGALRARTVNLLGASRDSGLFMGRFAQEWLHCVRFAQKRSKMVGKITHMKEEQASEARLAPHRIMMSDFSDRSCAKRPIFSENPGVYPYFSRFLLFQDCFKFDNVEVTLKFAGQITLLGQLFVAECSTD